MADSPTRNGRRCANEFPFVSPRSASDRPSPDLVILFLQAVADVTDAFKELRNNLLPAWNHPRQPVDRVDVWLKRWHLDKFRNYELTEMVYSWVFQVLEHWKAHPEAASSLRVDLGWWNPDPGRRVISDRAPLDITVAQWNPHREHFETYAAQRRKNFEKLLQEQRRIGEAELLGHGARFYRPRQREHDPRVVFKWLALSICAGKSDGEIAIIYRQPKESVETARSRIKKARMRLAAELGT
jgi:hypothetical protein